MRSFFIFISLIFMLTACNKSMESEQYLLTNVNIIEIESGEILEGQSILIEDETILDIFPDGSKNPPVSHSIPLPDTYAIPGLWDMHVHFRGGEELIASNRKLLPFYIAHGVTTVRDAGGDLTPSIFKWRSAIDQDSLTGPYIYTSGPKIDGPDATWEGSLEVVNQSDITTALDSLESIGADYVKIYESSLSGQAYLEIIRQAKERGFKVTGHMPMDIFIDDAIAAGLDGIEHLYYVLKGTSDREGDITADVYNGQLGFWDAISELKESYNEDTARVFYQKLADENVYVAPTLHIDDVLSFLHKEDHSNDAFLKRIPEDIQQTYQRRVRLAQNRSEVMNTFEKELNALFKKMTHDMHQAGVKLLAGSDAGAYNSYVYQGVSLHKELEAFVQSGISPLHALQTATIHSAEFFGEFEATASIKTGKTADLLIVSGNPLDDIRNTQKIEAVVFRGKYLSGDSLADILK